MTVAELLAALQNRDASTIVKVMVEIQTPNGAEVEIGGDLNDVCHNSEGGNEVTLCSLYLEGNNNDQS